MSDAGVELFKLVACETQAFKIPSNNWAFEAQKNEDKKSGSSAGKNQSTHQTP